MERISETETETETAMCTVTGDGRNGKRERGGVRVKGERVREWGVARVRGRGASKGRTAAVSRDHGGAG